MAPPNSHSEESDSDDLIQPDGVTKGDSSSAGDEFDLDDLAERAVDVVLVLLRRANALAGGVLMFAVLACVGGYVLGIAALGGGLRTLWILAGGLLAVWAIGSVVASMFRLRAVRRGSDAMVGEVFGNRIREKEKSGATTKGRMPLVVTPG